LNWHAPVPTQIPVQPTNVLPLSGVAVSVIAVPSVNEAEQLVFEPLQRKRSTESVLNW
jgi:hypothetical protein